VGMSKAIIIFVALAAAMVAVSAHSQFVYAGFEHVLVFDTDSISVTAFDYRRHLPHNSQCDAFINPPLLEGVKLEDWMSTAAISSNSQSDLVYTHMGYEVFLIENKKTGAFLTRRCRDFRPQLTALPCEALGTGRSDKLKDPFRTIFIGNDRVLILNTETAEFDVHLFDADVHTGGDPFRFGLGPLISGTFPFRDALKESNFAYVQLKNHGGDILLVQKPGGYVEGWRFNSDAKNANDWFMKFAFTRAVPAPYTLTTLGENQVIFYAADYNFTIVDVSQNDQREVSFAEISKGNAYKGHACITDNATACVGMDGCAWCPLTYSCHAYEREKSYFCDNVCAVPALVDSIKAGDAIIIPECVKEVPVEANHAEIFDTIEEGEKLLPGNIRLSREYRKDLGDHANSESAPIHPAIDNELGDEPKILNAEFQNEIIHEKSNVALGTVYVPPKGDESPCMNSGYDPKKAAEVPMAAISNWKMNIPPSNEAAPTFTRSPLGDAALATESDNCERKRNTTKTQSLDERFVPRQGDFPIATEEYSPAHTSSRHEEDLMNFDDTPFADIKGHMGVDEAKSIDPSHSPSRIAETLQFKPKEPARAPTPSKILIEQSKPILRVTEPTKVEMMNAGLATTDLANPDCTETGGVDGLATPTFNAAMKNAVIATMPETLEAQLNLFKHEEKQVLDNNMFPPSPPSEDHLESHLPLTNTQKAEVQPVDLGTAINGVSPDEEGERLNRINHRASSQ
jgi:hypothetical protein